MPYRLFLGENELEQDLLLQSLDISECSYINNLAKFRQLVYRFKKLYIRQIFLNRFNIFKFAVEIQKSSFILFL